MHGATSTAIEELVDDHARNSNALCNDVLGEIYRCCYREPDSIFNQKRHLVNFSNCTLNSSVATTTKVYVHAIQSADEIAANLIEEKLDLAEKPRKTEGG